MHALRRTALMLASTAPPGHGEAVLGRTRGRLGAQWFAHIASQTAAVAGHTLTFVLALGLILVWAVTGPLFDFSNTWQLIINTGTTIVTFLMVFLIQNTQNRDVVAMHLKLDELIRASQEADDAIIAAEDDTDEELAEMKQLYASLCDEHAALKARLEATTNGRTTPGAHAR